MMKIMYLRTMKGYIYNITISADRSCGGDVLYFVEHRLFPTWLSAKGGSAPSYSESLPPWRMALLWLCSSN